MAQIWPPKLSDIGRFILLAVIVFALNGSDIGDTATFLALFVGVFAAYEMLERYTQSYRTAIPVTTGLATAVAAGGIAAFPDSRLVYLGLLVAALWLFVDMYTTPPDDDDRQQRSSSARSITDDRLQVAIFYGIRDKLADTEEPKTTIEIADTLDVSPSRVEKGLNILVTDGLVRETETGYVRDENEIGSVPMGRHLTKQFVSRLLRPLRTLRKRHWA